MDYTFLRPKRVHEALAGHPDRPSLRTVTRWCEGHPVPAWADAVVRAKIGVPQEEHRPPAWAEGLADKTAKRIIELLAPADLVQASERLIAQLEALQRQADDSSRASEASEAQGGAGRPDPALS